MAEFAETTALLMALDGCTEDDLEDYLRENFLPNELRNLVDACQTVSECASSISNG